MPQSKHLMQPTAASTLRPACVCTENQRVGIMSDLTVTSSLRAARSDSSSTRSTPPRFSPSGPSSLAAGTTPQSNALAATIQTGTGHSGPRFHDTFTPEVIFTFNPRVSAPPGPATAAPQQPWIVEGTPAIRTADPAVVPTLASVVGPSDIQSDSEIVVPPLAATVRSLRLTGQ